MESMHVLEFNPPPCTLFLLVPLPNSAAPHPDMLPRRAEANPDIDPALPRSDEPCMIIHESYEDNGTVVLSMPCGHPISPGGLMDYCWNELKSNKTEIKCPLCTREWSVEVVKRYGGVTEEEFQLLEERLGKNFCTSDDSIKTCARCRSYCSRENNDNPRVVCLICSRSLQRSYHFCWHCLREWNRNSGVESCGYEDCRDEEKLRRLKDSPMVIIREMPRLEMYKLRACPHCGEIISCTGAVLKTLCTKCNTEFCFNCLRMEFQGSLPCNKVGCALEPIQKKIPNLRLEENVGNNAETRTSCNIL